MILVDTSVWTELQRPEPDRRVQAWELANAPQLWLSTVVIGELMSGATLLPDGRRKLALQDTYTEMIEVHFDRVVPFDLDAARLYGTALAYLSSKGRNPGTADAQIAATALSRQMSLATRNVHHFEGLGIMLIDPWTA